MHKSIARSTLGYIFLVSCLAGHSAALGATPTEEAGGVEQDLRCMAIVMGLAPENAIFMDSGEFFTTGIAGLGYWMRKIVVAEPDIDLGKRLKQEIVRVQDVRQGDDEAVQSLVSDVETCAAEWMPVINRFNAAFPGGTESDRDRQASPERP